MLKRLLSFNHWLNHHEILLFLLLLTVILRLPTLFEPFWYGDENIYLAIGQGIRQGLTLYTDITDFPNKPPAIYLIASLVKNVANFRLLLLFWHLTHVALVFFVTNLISKHKLLATNLTLLFIFLSATPLIEGTIANAEIFFILPTTAALAFLLVRHRRLTLSATPRLHFFAGLMLGLGFLFKIHVAFDILAFGLFFYIFPLPFKIQSLPKLLLHRPLWIFALGVLTPIIISFLYLALLGVSPTFLFQNASGSTTYVSAWQSSGWLIQLLGFGSLLSRGFLLLILTLILYLFYRRRPSLGVFFMLWFFYALFAVLLSARPYPHYLLQLLPPVILGLAYFLATPKKPHLFVVGSLTLFFILTYVRFDFSTWKVIPYYQNFLSYTFGQIDQTEYYRRFDSRMPRNYQLAKTITRHAAIGERIYVWGTEPELYVLSDRLPAGRLVVSFHVSDLDYYQPTIAALEADPPAVIVWMESETRPFPALQAFINRRYAFVAALGDPGRSFAENQGRHGLVYRRL